MQNINSSQVKDFKSAKKIIEREMVNNILEYLNHGVFPNNKPSGYMNAYTAVNILSDLGDKQSADLLNYHDSTIESYIIDCKKKLNKETTNNLIDAFIEHTEHITILIYWMNRIFCYLDRFYTKAKTKKSLATGAMELYKSRLFDDFQKNIFLEVNKLIKEDRNGNKESRAKVKAIMRILKELDLDEPKIIKENNKISWISGKNSEKEGADVQNDWYGYFEGETVRFAKDKANQDIHSMSAPEYVLSQLKYLAEEKERKEEFINSKFYEKIDKINHQCLIGDVMNELAQMDTGVKNMLETKNNAQLSNLYQLFKLYPDSLKEITEEFQPYIKNRGNVIYNNKELSKDPKKFIPELISLKKEMDSLVLECFENNNLFQDVKNKAFSLFMTKDVYAKQLSNYVDYCMRIGFKGKSQEEIESTLNDIIGLFKCLNSKLVFQNDSNKKMSERLIKKVSLSSVSEQLFISKLKQEAGTTYVSKMQEMMSDLEKNKKETEQYKSLSHKGAPNGIKLDITVISQSAWEISKKSMEKIEMPKYLSSCLDDFEQFYLKKHQGQKLLWCLGLSKVEIQYLYLKNKNVSTSTLLQLLCLLQIEKAKRITIKKISDNLGIASDELLKDINGLIFNPSFNPTGHAENGIIIKTFKPKNKEFNEDDEVSINMNVNTQKLKFNTISLPTKKTEKELKEQEEKDEIVQKKYKDNIIQAAITRIMKSRIGQITTHDWLVSETSKQIGLFVAQPPTIKMSIEKLIEKNIIKRNAKKSNCYDYIS